MDWKLALTTFTAVFLAELGDKTQLATMSLAAGNKARWVVFAGAALALVTTSALGVLAGDVVARYVPIKWVHRAAAVLFVVLGVWMIIDRSGLSAISSDLVNLFSAEVVTVARHMAPSMSRYAGATALIAMALAIWWWAERDVTL